MELEARALEPLHADVVVRLVLCVEQRRDGETEPRGGAVRAPVGGDLPRGKGRRIALIGADGLAGGRREALAVPVVPGGRGGLAGADVLAVGRPASEQ